MTQENEKKYKNEKSLIKQIEKGGIWWRRGEKPVWTEINISIATWAHTMMAPQ